MIVHCSQKLAAHLPGVSDRPLDEDSRLGSWHAHLFHLDRRQCVMFCHDATRYVLFASALRKPDFADLDKRCFRPLFTATLSILGCSDAEVKKAQLALGPLRYDRATDRSVQASLRVAKQDLEAWLWRVPNVMDLDPLAVSCWLNERPATIHGRTVWPEDAMRKAVAEL